VDADPAKDPVDQPALPVEQQKEQDTNGDRRRHLGQEERRPEEAARAPGPLKQECERQGGDELGRHGHQREDHRVPEGQGDLGVGHDLPVVVRADELRVVDDVVVGEREVDRVDDRIGHEDQEADHPRADEEEGRPVLPAASRSRRRRPRRPPGRRGRRGRDVGHCRHPVLSSHVFQASSSAACASF
jgi:hypothetical protein